MFIALAVLTAILAVATLLPFLPLAHGLVRAGDFPRQQILAMSLVLLGAALLWGDASLATRLVQAALLAVAAIQARHVLPYTILWRKETADFDPAKDRGTPIRLLVCNVKMSNRRYDGLVSSIADRDPDLFVLMEVDGKWMDAIGDLLAAYPHVVAQPQENSYGMVLASKFELSDIEVEDMLTEGVPSIVATVHPEDGPRFRLYSIHPEPPVPHRGTEGRDGETSLVALRVREETLPVLVTGDLNDVAWSGTTKRFRKVSRLLDPRIGRKVFSTFDARYPLVRWPLDHLFHSPDFRLREMHRLPACGSDHFPVMFDLVLCAAEEAESMPEAADKADIERAEELVEEAAKRDQKAIGTDWET